MRLVGLILVLLGAVALAVYGFGSGAGSAAPPGTGVGVANPLWLSPVLGGIALVSGLILLASAPRRA